MKKIVISLIFSAGAFVSAAGSQVLVDAQRINIFAQTCAESFANKGIDSWISYSEKNNSIILGGRTKAQKTASVLKGAAEVLAAGALVFGAYGFYGSSADEKTANGNALFWLCGLAGVYKVREGGNWVYRYFTANDIAQEGTLVLTPEHIIIPHFGTFKWEMLSKARLVQPTSQNKKRRIAFDIKGGHSFEWDALNPQLMEHAVYFINAMMNNLNNPSRQEAAAKSIVEFKRCLSHSFTTPASERFLKNFARSPLQGKMFFIADQKPVYAERFNQGLAAAAAALGLSVGAVVEWYKAGDNGGRRGVVQVVKARYTAPVIACGLAALACGIFAAERFFRTVFGSGIVCLSTGFMVTGKSFYAWSDVKSVEVLTLEKGKTSQARTLVFHIKNGERVRWDKCPQEIAKNMELFVNMLIESNPVQVVA